MVQLGQAQHGRSIYAAYSIVATLVARRRNQEVARIDGAMAEAIASTLGEQAARR